MVGLAGLLFKSSGLIHCRKCCRKTRSRNEGLLCCLAATVGEVNEWQRHPTGQMTVAVPVAVQQWCWQTVMEILVCCSCTAALLHLSSAYSAACLLVAAPRADHLQAGFSTQWTKAWLICRKTWLMHRLQTKRRAQDEGSADPVDPVVMTRQPALVRTFPPSALDETLK